MNKIIDLKERSRKPPENLITREPWEFRRSDWGSLHFIQMLRSESRKLEAHRDRIQQQGGWGVEHIPPHYTLRGGMASTIRALFRYRYDGSGMREVYYLAGLMDCMINQFSPLLRTDLLRDMYNREMDLKNHLNVNWYGQMNQVLFPIDHHLYSDHEYRQGIFGAETMKDLYVRIREGTDEMFDILSLEYTFYTPGRGHEHGTEQP